MKVGNRIEFKQRYAGAIDETIDIPGGGAFTLVSVEILFASAGTGAFAISTISDVIGESVETMIWRETDISIANSYELVFDKECPNGRKIHLDHPNATAQTIDVLVVYAIDQNVM